MLVRRTKRPRRGSRALRCALRIAASAAVAALASWLAPGAAAAQDETAAWGSTGLVVGAKVGGGIGAPLNEFGGAFVGELELGYALPLPEPVGRSLELLAAGAYLAPSSGDVVQMADSRLPGSGSFEYQVQQQAAVLTLGLRYRIPLLDDTLAPYFGAGGRMYLMRTEVDGSVDGARFGVNEETASTFGLHLAGGVDFRLGPGALLAELQLGYTALDAYVLRDTNLGALLLLVGYRLMP